MLPPGPDLLRLKQLKNSLQVLLGNIEGIGNEINGGIQKLANRFDQFESPLGKIPLVFQRNYSSISIIISCWLFYLLFSPATSDELTY